MIRYFVHLYDEVRKGFVHDHRRENALWRIQAYNESYLEKILEVLKSRACRRTTIETKTC